MLDLKFSDTGWTQSGLSGFIWVRAGSGLNCHPLWLPCLCLLLLTNFAFASTSPLKNIPKLGVVRGRTIFLNPSKKISTSEPEGDLETYYYDQTLDHFNYNPQSYLTPHRYVLNFNYWGGGGAMAAPILAYLGEESSLDDDLGGIGWLIDNAHRFKALQVYIEVSN